MTFIGYKEHNTRAIVDILTNPNLIENYELWQVNKLTCTVSDCKLVDGVYVSSEWKEPANICIHRFRIPNWCDFENESVKEKFYRNYVDFEIVQQKINEIFGENFKFDFINYATTFENCYDDYGNKRFCCTPVDIILVPPAKINN